MFTAREKAVADAKKRVEAVVQRYSDTEIEIISAREKSNAAVEVAGVKRSDATAKVQEVFALCQWLLRLCCWKYQKCSMIVYASGFSLKSRPLSFSTSLFLNLKGPNLSRCGIVKIEVVKGPLCNQAAG